MYHPTTRVLAVLELLQTRAQLSGADIAARLGIDTRTVRRYIVTLEEIGIPITSQRGRDGGDALMAGFKLPPMMFTDDEALALSVGLLAARVALAEAAPAAASAQAKLERIMPAELKRRVRAVSQTVRLDFSGPSTAPSGNKTLVALSSAALAQQRVLLHYRGQDGARSEREVDPYGLALRGGCWYLVGLCRLRGGMRSFRLGRIASVAPRPLTFARPASFDALAYLRESIAGIARAHAIEVMLKTDLQSASAHFFNETGFFEPTADGVRLRGQADDLDWFARQLCAASFDARIVGPDALRASVAALAGRLAAMAQLG
ncbi:helix-turn-helix transcriptional regulator [Massilia sp. TWR1-2-2]|uniref:helix-turn-helix transcriptional regulator n=1 Tax=Massilia sp. TWR1-2-2 TaxID=2804584 RepID=UPI003CF0CA3D